MYHAAIHPAPAKGVMTAKEPPVARKVTGDALYELYRSAENGNLAGLRQWVDDYGAENIDKCRDKYNRTALLEAVVSGRSATALFLIAAGADPDHTAGNGVTPLHAAALGDKADIAAALLDAGADIERKWGDLTPLQQAAAYGHAKMMRLLIDRGADPTCLSAKGETLAAMVFNDKDGAMTGLATQAASRVFGERQAKACTEGTAAPVRTLKKIAIKKSARPAG